MSLNDVMVQIKERLTKVDPNNRKAVGIFQMKTAGQDWVVDLKDLKVYEGSVDNADTTVTSDLETLFAMLQKKITMEDAMAQGKMKVEGDLDFAIKANKIHN